jgi:MFS family permease
MRVSTLPGAAAPSPSFQIFSTVFVTFVGYLTIALPLAVLPGFVHSSLGYGVVLAGLAISTQYIATVVSRAQVGRMSDIYGPKRAVMVGFLGCLLSGVLTFVGALTQHIPPLSLGLLLAGRLALGIAESWVGTGAITWAIGQVGPQHTVRIISWNGVATFGALAVGAPLGVVLVQWFGFASIGLASCLLALIGLALAVGKPAVAVIAEKRLSLRSVVMRVLPYGCVLACASAGFGIIAAFISLYFQSRQWQGASFALSGFGIAFIGARLLFSDLILRHGGLRVALVALAVECAGLLLLWSAPIPALAILAAALTGFGFAPIFPALGVVAVGRVPPQSRGAALGLFSVFLDVSLGIQGPLAGLLIDHFGSGSPFMLGAAASALALAMTAVLLAR